MKKGTKQAQLNKEYSKATRAFWRQAQSMFKRGYIINTVLPDKPKRITAGSIRRVKAQQAKLYKESQYITETGEVVSGEQGRTIERGKNASKSAFTRALKKAFTQYTEGINERVKQRKVREKQRKKDEEKRRQQAIKARLEQDQQEYRAMKDEGYAGQFTNGEIAYQTVLGYIQDIDAMGYSLSARELKWQLDNVTGALGLDRVKAVLGTDTSGLMSILSEVSASAYKAQGARFSRAITAFRNIFFNDIPSAEDYVQMSDAMMYDEGWDEATAEDLDSVFTSG